MINTRIKPLHGYQICPFCGGNVEYAGISSGHIFPSINTGQMYICRKCGYKGGFIIEVDDLDDVRKLKESLNMHKDDIGFALSYPKKWMGFYRLWLILLIAVLVFGIIGIIYEIR